MIIVKYWRQFGRRYFWPHLLLGIIAAGMGLSITGETSLPVQLPVAVFSPLMLYSLSQERAARTPHIQRGNYYQTVLTTDFSYAQSEYRGWASFLADDKTAFQVSEWLASVCGIRAGPCFSRQ